VALFFALLLAALQMADAQVQAERVSHLALSIERAEGVRAVKRLQIAYAQYSQFGLWNEMATLFTADAEVVYGRESARGRDAIRTFLIERFGDGRMGLPAGGVHTQLALMPIVVLDAGGETARGRWYELSLLGGFGDNAAWAGGIQDDDYVKEDGVWKIARLRYYHQLGGPYETGWRTVASDVPIVPYRYSPADAGTPVPRVTDSEAAALARRGSVDIAALERRIAELNDEDEIRNLQNAYGYYVDRKMWDDVVDLFEPDGVLEIANVGVYRGAASVRRALERDGPAGLRHGELNEHLQLSTLVTLSGDGTEARARGIELGMLGDTESGDAYWAVTVFANRYVKENGIWRVREMRLFPIMKTHYDLGWAKSMLTESAPAPSFAPDAPPTARYSLQNDAVIPVFSYPHPVGGHEPSYPRGVSKVGDQDLTTAAAETTSVSASPSSLAERLDAAERGLARSIAYDAVENLSGAFGEYLNDEQGDYLGRLFAERGMRQRPFNGFYIGYERIRESAERAWGPPQSPRTVIRTHLRLQPVIHAAPDGRSAKLRSRLLLFPTYRDRGGAPYNGMYHDVAVLEGGAWKFWNVAIDDIYFRTESYELGWARAQSQESAPAAQSTNGGASTLRERYPPDIPLSALGVREVGMRGGVSEPIEWPAIKPMWFHYRNPVSGRVPENYWPDCVPCVYMPSISLESNGY